MKHMPLVLAQVQAGTGTLSTESVNDTLSMEGIADALKKPLTALKAKFSLSDEKAFEVALKIKRELLNKERKSLGKAKTAVSQSKDTGNHKVSLKRVMKQVNFSASTPEQLVAGMVKNRAYVKNIIGKFKDAKTKKEVEALHDQIDAEFAKKGNVSEEMTISRDQALKIIDEAVNVVNMMEEYLDVAEEANKRLHSTNMSQEGIRDVLAGVLRFAGEIMISVVILILSAFAVWFVITSILVNPFLIIVYAGLWMIGTALATEGVDDTSLIKGLIMV